MTLLNIQKLSAVACIVKQHRLASVLRQFGKIRWAHENNFVGRMAPRFCMAGHCESRYSREGQLYDLNDLFSVHCISPFLSTIAQEKSWLQSVIFISHKSSRSRDCVYGVPVDEAAFLMEHRVFRRFNPSAESWPSPPNHKKSEH